MKTKRSDFYGPSALHHTVSACCFRSAIRVVETLSKESAIKILRQFMRDEAVAAARCAKREANA